jgi:hypothetical protein
LNKICFTQGRRQNWDGENMPNPHLQIHPVFIPMTSGVRIWDFRLRISDLWNRYALSIYNGQNSLNLKSKFKNLKLHPTCRGTKMGLKRLNETHQFLPPQAGTIAGFHS